MLRDTGWGADMHVKYFAEMSDAAGDLPEQAQPT